MQHRRKGRQLGRKSGQRRALLKTLLGSLIVHERITTTEAKAKEMKNFIDQIVNKAKRSRADVAQKVAMTRALTQVIPAMAAKKILGEFATRFEGRKSGYTRVIKMDQRKSDGAKMAVIEFV